MEIQVSENQVLSTLSFEEIDSLDNAVAESIVGDLKSNINWKSPQVAFTIAQYPSMKYAKTEQQFDLS